MLPLRRHEGCDWQGRTNTPAGRHDRYSDVPGIQWFLCKPREGRDDPSQRILMVSERLRMRTVLGFSAAPRGLLKGRAIRSSSFQRATSLFVWPDNCEFSWTLTVSQGQRKFRGTPGSYCLCSATPPMVLGCFCGGFAPARRLR